MQKKADKPAEKIEDFELQVLREAKAALDEVTREPAARLAGAQAMLMGRYQLRAGIDRIDLQTGAIVRGEPA